MPRTTVDIDATVLRDLKRRQKREGKSLGQLISELLTIALAREARTQEEPEEFSWITRSMGARVDLEDKEAVQAVLEGREPRD